MVFSLLSFSIVIGKFVEVYWYSQHSGSILSRDRRRGNVRGPGGLSEGECPTVISADGGRQPAVDVSRAYRSEGR